MVPVFVPERSYVSLKSQCMYTYILATANNGLTLTLHAVYPVTAAWSAGIFIKQTACDGHKEEIGMQIVFAWS